jgi:tRNA pseudouridine38-40 synthase
VNEAQVFRLTIAYDGTQFHGWQRQPDMRTVQGELERALREVLAQEVVTLNGAGRTDTGVHARGQVASFRATTALPAHAFPPMLQRQLPRDIRVMDAAACPAHFHARHSARGRRYTYRLLDSHDVLYERFAWYPQREVSESALRAAVSALPGEHDYSAFQAKGSSEVDPRCRVDAASVSRWPGGLQFDVQADHFLYHMVRNLIGTALFAARKRDPAAHMAAVLGSRDRARAAGTAPPHGLCLEQVIYEAEDLTP